MLITIITIVKNDSCGLLRTLKSVEAQNLSDFEYVVVDGNSVDNTISVINEHRNIIDKFVTGSDSGISEAFNRGISLSTGKYLLMLNAGDELFDCNVVANLYALLTGQYYGSDVLCCGVFVNENKVIPIEGANCGKIPHQGLLVNKSAYMSYGGYSVGFRLRMDYEFLLRVSNNGIRFDYSDLIVANYMQGGVSNQMINRFLFYREGLAAQLLHGDVSVFGNLVRSLYWGLKYLVKK